MSDVVSLHPYFRAHDAAGLAAFRDLLPRFVEKTRSEPACLFYDFTVNGDEIFCREAYRGAAGVQAHLANVGALLDEALTHSELIRLEVHGPAAELEKLKPGMEALCPSWFEYACGLGRP